MGTLLLLAEGGEAHDLTCHDRYEDRRQVGARDAATPEGDPIVRFEVVEVLVGHDAPICALPRSDMKAAHRDSVGVRRISNQHVLDAHPGIVAGMCIRGKRTGSTTPSDG